MKCEHESVSMKDGSLDKICLKCGNKFKQGQLIIEPSINININITPEFDDTTIVNNIIDNISKNLERG